MACKQIRTKLSDYIDGALPLTEKTRVEAHLADCPACREALADLEATVELLQAAPKVNAPDNFLEQVNAQIDALQGNAPIWERIRQFLFVPFKIKIPMQLAAATAMAVMVIMVVSSPEMKHVSEKTLKKYARTDAVEQTASRSAEQPALIYGEADEAPLAAPMKKKKPEIALNDRAAPDAEAKTVFDAEMGDMPAVPAAGPVAGNRVEEPVAADRIARDSAPPAPAGTVGASAPVNGMAEGMTDRQRLLSAARAPAPRESMPQAASVQEKSAPLAVEEAMVAEKAAEPLIITLVPYQKDEVSMPAPQMMAEKKEAVAEAEPEEIPSEEKTASPTQLLSDEKPADSLERLEQDVKALVKAVGGKIVTIPVVPADDSEKASVAGISAPLENAPATISALIPAKNYADFLRQLERLGRYEPVYSPDSGIRGRSIRLTIQIIAQ